MKCAFIKEPTVTVIYIFVVGSAHYKRLAMKFVRLFNERPPDYPHRLVIACNGAQQITPAHQKLFEMLPQAEFYRHNNVGWDIGAFQAVAQSDKNDLLVFLGSSCIPTREGWLQRIMESYELHGDALYGSMHHLGNSFCGIRPHIRTTGFWMPRHLFASYPIRIKTYSERYDFEHRKLCLTSWMVENGYEAYAVTWKGEWGFHEWGKVKNGYHQGKQADLIFRDRLTEFPHHTG